MGTVIPFSHTVSQEFTGKMKQGWASLKPACCKNYAYSLPLEGIVNPHTLGATENDE